MPASAEDRSAGELADEGRRDGSGNDHDDHRHLPPGSDDCHGDSRQTRVELGLPIIISIPAGLKLFPGELVDLNVEPDVFLKGPKTGKAKDDKK